MFTVNFSKYACEGDTIQCQVDGFTAVATLYRDDCSDSPVDRQDGFWPSLDPNDAGYIGAKSKSTLARHMRKARAVLKAWENDEWFYVGVAVTIYKNGILLTSKYDHACWGVDCNYPGSDNSYLREVANEDLHEALNAARETLKKLCECADAA